ncbi:MAG: cytochrome c family protein [Rhodospirillales bacterium]|nr:cytochrome c family protein [Rhodospirillales bacterium]
MKHTSLLEKLGLALLIFGWLVYGSINLGNILVHAEEGNIDDLRIVVEGSDDVAEEETQVAAVDFGTLLASADMGKGEKMFKKCASCHTITDGGKDKVGPALWGIVGRAKGSTGFSFSGAITDLGGAWTPDDLNMFLENPKGYAPGTKMSFKGVGDPAKRAALIAYLMLQGG